MSDSSDIEFDPKHSIQDGLEIEVGARLDEKFPEFLDSLIRCCSGVQKFSFDLIRPAVEKELRLRFKQEFAPKGNDEFELRKVRFRFVVEFVDSLGEGSIICAFRLAGVDERRQTIRRTMRRFSESLTANAVMVRAEQSLRKLMPIVTDIVHRIVRATNGWLETRLNKINDRAGSNALTAIRHLLVQEFGALAGDMPIYPYAETGSGYDGAYLMDDELFGTVVERIRRGEPSSASRAEQLAALIDATMDVSLTESRKALKNRKPLRLRALSESRLYEGEHREFHQAENALYGPTQLITHPLVFEGEVMRAQMVLIYPARFIDEMDAKFPERVEKLRPKILEVLKNHDLISPILRFDRRFRKQMVVSTHDSIGATSIEAHIVKEEILTILRRFRGWEPPNGDPASVVTALVAITSTIMDCHDEAVLREAKLCLVTGVGMRSLKKLKTVLKLHE